MSSTLFKITEHTGRCQHIRGYPNGTKRRQEDILKLAIKQYTPLDNLDPSDGAVTIIAGHANGIPKEVYEPLWDELLNLSKTNGFEIRSIWFADMSWQGASGVLNEELQGDDPNYFDHSRDLLQMINDFRDQMPRPIVGIGHSMGSCQLVNLSIMHPRLFTTLILIEPMIQRAPPAGPNAAMRTTFRPDLWPSRAAAEAELRKNKFYASWDPRALERYLQHGLRAVPTAIYPVSATVPAGAVTLTTPKHQEAWSFLRASLWPQETAHGKRVVSRADRLLNPELPEHEMAYAFTRPEPGIAEDQLPHVRPSVLYVLGGKSYMNTAEVRAVKMARTGVGLGGSGGVAEGKVEEKVVSGQSHMLPCEDVVGCAKAMAGWLGRQMEVFRAEEEFVARHERGKSERGKLVVSRMWMDMVRKPSTVLRPVKEKL